MNLTPDDKLLSLLHNHYRAHRQMRRGKPTGKWYIQFYTQSPHSHYWRVGGAQGCFESKQEADTWVHVMRRFHPR